MEFFRTSRSLQAATAAAVLCKLVAATPPKPLRGASSPSLELGERLCYAYEALQACYPKAELEFEQLLLLVTGLAEGSCLRLGQCTRCGAAILIDTLSVRDFVCVSGCSNY